MRTTSRPNINTNEFWDKAHQEDVANGVPNDRLIFYHQIIPWLDHGFKRLLEIGCATGYGLDEIRKTHALSSFTGYDFSRYAIRYATQKYKDIKFVRHNIISSDLTENYDYILMIEIIEHFRHPFKVIDKCVKNCRELIITVPHEARSRKTAPGHLFDDFKVEDFKKYKVIDSKIFLDDSFLAVLIKGDL